MRCAMVLLLVMVVLVGCAAPATPGAQPPPSPTTTEKQTTSTVPATTTTTAAPITTTSTKPPTTTTPPRTTTPAPPPDPQIGMMTVGGKQRPIDWVLAMLNADDAGLDEDDDSVYVFRRHVLNLVKKTTQTQEEIADISVNTWQLGREAGYPDTLLRVIEELDTSIPSDGPRMNLAEIAALWLMLRTAE